MLEDAAGNDGTGAAGKAVPVFFFGRKPAGDAQKKGDMVPHRCFVSRRSPVVELSPHPCGGLMPGFSFPEDAGKEPWKAARPDSAFRVVQGPSPFARSPGRRQRSKGLPPLQKHAPSKGEKHNINKLFQLDRQHPNISPVKGLPQVQRSSEKARRGKDGSVGE